MQEFASAAMLRLLIEAVRIHGGVQEGQRPEAQSTRATVPLDIKRIWVDRLVGCAGLKGLVALDGAIHRLRDDPLYAGLVQGGQGGVFGLLARWQRLERYIHSRHQVRLIQQGPNQAVLRHEARGDAAAPHPAEDLLVAGVLLGLARVSVSGLIQLRVGQAKIDTNAEEVALAQLVASGDTAQWEIVWSSGTQDELPRPDGSRLRLHVPATLSSVFTPLWSALMEDPIRPPSLREGAFRMGCSPRSLQRALQEQGWTFRRLVHEARAATATWWLLHSEEPVAQIGFTCGYADQAHFTRLFKHRTGLTPGQFRREFSTSREPGNEHAML
jgi:AraC-like DNA-binding protein